MRLWTLSFICFSAWCQATPAQSQVAPLQSQVAPAQSQVAPAPSQASSIQRIVSLAPHATEIAFAAGLGDKLVAVSEHSDYPPAAQKIEKVANYQGIKIERILALHPDLVLAWPSGNPARELDKLRQLGLNIYYSETGDLDSIATNIEKLSQYADDPSVGARAAADFRQQLSELRDRYADARPVRYFYQLSQKPIITLAQNGWPTEVFRFCGGENVFQDSPSPYPQIGIEQVLVAQPEVIFTSQHAMANGTMWWRWSEQLPAVAKRHVWSLNSDWINRPTPRTLNAIKQVCDYFDQVRNQ